MDKPWTCERKLFSQLTEKWISQIQLTDHDIKILELITFLIFKLLLEQRCAPKSLLISVITKEDVFFSEKLDECN